MLKRLSLALIGAIFFFGAASAQAQPGPRVGWSGQVDGLAVWQGDAAISGNGSFSVNRGFIRGSAIYFWDPRTSAGVSLSFGRFDYRFQTVGPRPWEDITDLRISAPVRFAVGQRATAIVVPSLRYDYESGAGASSGQTYGVFAGISWRVNGRLAIGPAFGVFRRIEESSLDVFPALLVNWDINDRFNLSTGTALGATQGPGLSLAYALNDDWKLSLTARSERVRFRLNTSGLAPNGVGEDASVPVVVSVNYGPNPGIALNIFAGAEFNGRLRLDNAAGTTISKQSYDTAPIAGIAFRLRF